MDLGSDEDPESVGQEASQHRLVAAGAASLRDQASQSRLTTALAPNFPTGRFFLFSNYNYSYVNPTDSCSMPKTSLTKPELQIMEALWTQGKCSIREIQETFPEKGRPAYSTVQTMVYRLEVKKAVRRVKKISNAHIFEAMVSRSAAQRKLIDEFLTLFGGRTQPVMARLIEAGKLTLEDVEEARKTLERLARKEKP